MSLTVTVLRRGHLIGGIDCRLCDVLFDSSYNSGGEALGSEVGLNSILAAIDTGAGVAEGPYRFKYNLATSKMQAFRSGAGGVQVYAESDIKGSVSADVPIAGGTLPTNGQLWSTLAAANNTTA